MKAKIKNKNRVLKKKSFKAILVSFENFGGGGNVPLSHHGKEVILNNFSPDLCEYFYYSDGRKITIRDDEFYEKLTSLEEEALNDRFDELNEISENIAYFERGNAYGL